VKKRIFAEGDKATPCMICLAQYRKPKKARLSQDVDIFLKAVLKQKSTSKTLYQTRKYSGHTAFNLPK
jgi:hypothetical protein